MNVRVTMPNMDSNAYIIGLVQPIVDGGKLPLYTSSNAEAQFLAKNNVSTLYSPLLKPGGDGYNSGNNLIGLYDLVVVTVSANTLII